MIGLEALVDLDLQAHRQSVAGIGERDDFIEFGEHRVVHPRLRAAKVWD